MYRCAMLLTLILVSALGKRSLEYCYSVKRMKTKARKMAATARIDASVKEKTTLQVVSEFSSSSCEYVESRLLD